MTGQPIIKADFVKPQPVPSRKVLQLVFEVPEEEADHAMAVLGGYPQSGQNRWCAIAQLAEGMPTEADVPDEEACPDCAGKGKVIRSLKTEPPTVVVCSKCQGTGRAKTKKTPASHRVEQPSEATPEPTETEHVKRSWHELSLREQSVLRCKQTDFQTWLRQEALAQGSEWSEEENQEDRAARCIRAWCQVESRAELDDPQFPGGHFWIRIEEKYRAAQEGRDQQYQDEREQGRI